MSRRMLVGFLVAVGMAASGCGGGDGGITPRTACEDAQASLCERLYTCYTPAELATIGFPSNEAACVSMLQVAEGCERQTTDNTCIGNERYQPSQANMCIDQINGLECGQVRDPDLVLNVAAPACGRVCAIP